ncbi:ATP-grasp fold amidoligase family protein [Acetobacterium bakii]|uniref:Glycosyl transferase n=1 Tax=Acetobacterium bakii TaxID=52689 RepID=A0A0L6U2M2_9FIRM|nr:ATP-grasp fold amidoligase family protein [Acetobacterium bakii]KNZ42035.1 hypothetical protein AKG39_08860 [Acetobacterium bakii]
MDNITKNWILTPMNLLYRISPKLDLRILYKLKTGHKLNLDQPVSFTEKLQWIKLYEKNELMTKCCDKYMVRNYVQSCDCGEILNTLLWEGFDPADIPFDDLPNQFVIKTTHGSSFNIICENKWKLNRNKTRFLLKKWLKSKYLPCYGEWFYGVEPPRIIIEKHLKNRNRSALFDYRFFCFHGEPKLIYIDTWKDDKTRVNLYDPNFNLLADSIGEDDHDFESQVFKPDRLDEMLEYSRKLSKNFLHVRVDFYYVNGNIIFGELSFTESAGFCKITPHALDIKMGNWLTLPI